MEHLNFDDPFYKERPRPSFNEPDWFRESQKRHEGTNVIGEIILRISIAFFGFVAILIVCFCISRCCQWCCDKTDSRPTQSCKSSSLNFFFIHFPSKLFAITQLFDVTEATFIRLYETRDMRCAPVSWCACCVLCAYFEFPRCSYKYDVTSSVLLFHVYFCWAQTVAALVSILLTKFFNIIVSRIFRAIYTTKRLYPR